MDKKIRLLPEALLLTLIGGLLVHKALSGGLALYIHPRYHLWLGITGGLLALFGVARFIWGKTAVRSDLLLLPGFVVLFLVIVPARPLGASLVPTKSLAAQSNADLIARLEHSRSENTRQWSLLDWTAALRSEGVAALVGKEVSYDGFVFRDATLPADSIYVGRYVVTCCTADGRALALAVEAEGATSYADDQWVQVEGTLVMRTIDGEQVPFVEGTLIPIETPKVPYLYP